MRVKPKAIHTVDASTTLPQRYC